tara:strand:+ start:5515 stop:5823 length:309 start_codon:yes stop_codon:yes gene_type:complete
MTVAEYLEGFSVESLVLASGIFGLFLIVIGLHVRNIRWVRAMASSEASVAARIRIEKLISSVEKMTTPTKSVSKKARPLNKGRKFVPAARTVKTVTGKRHAR